MHNPPMPLLRGRGTMMKKGVVFRKTEAIVNPTDESLLHIIDVRILGDCVPCKKGHVHAPSVVIPWWDYQAYNVKVHVKDVA